MNNESKKGKPKKENKSEKLYNEINELKEKVSLLEDKNIYSCPKCSAMIRPEKELPLIKGSIATPSLVAGIMNALSTCCGETR